MWLTWCEQKDNTRLVWLPEVCHPEHAMRDLVGNVIRGSRYTDRKKEYVGSSNPGLTWTSDLRQTEIRKTGPKSAKPAKDRHGPQTCPSTEQHKLALLQLDGCSQIHHGLDRDDAIGFLVVMHGHHELEPAELVEESLEIPL